MKTKVPDFEIQIWQMEENIAQAETAVGGNNSFIREAQGHLENAIRLLCGFSEQGATSDISELFENASQVSSGRRESAIFTLRALAVDDLLPFDKVHLLEKRAVELIEAGFSDQLKYLKLNEKRQTFEKRNALTGFHESICQQLRVLTKLQPTLVDINSTKDDILSLSRVSTVNAYLQPYCWQQLKGKISLILDQISEIVGCNDASYKQRFDTLTESCDGLAQLIDQYPSFLSKKYVASFHKAVKDALSSLINEAGGRFSCELEPRRKQPSLAEKRYPLHMTDKILTITIPFVNHGPGMAIDVTVEIDGGNQTSLALDCDEISLGDIPPGEFAVSFRAIVMEKAQSVQMAMEISWSQLFAETKSLVFDLKLDAQDPNVDWAMLERLDPYSLEVADGERFVGRVAKVQAIGNRLLKEQMTSTYITGQKRIGKTSLAQAVLRYLHENASASTKYETLYLEWGEYCSSNALKTVSALGSYLHEFLCSHLPSGINIPNVSFDGTLAPLNSVVKLLETTCKFTRFVIVLDEFDEIHPEMYRYGALAEAFFANLRTLSAKKNIAFILVGGEKMPFIIGAQGDQLNKFVREPLDYFSRSEEWTDYVELVTSPVHGSLNWEDSALTELFNLTAGHPYYTKLLCGKVFANAVSERDTEIISSDVKHGFNSRISELDTNAFAHFWKDGINAERDESEVIELKRLRVLVAFGRALRSGSVKRQAISQQLAGEFLLQSDIGPIVDDFCRRDVMRETAGNVTIYLPIFQRWICDVGVTKLISSTLADDLESELQKANDSAYVKAGEINETIKGWPLYRGKVISSEVVRGWLDQVQSPQDQRLLFKLLQNLKFITPAQISEHLIGAHTRVIAKGLPPMRRESKVEKRRDVLVTYLDGPGKSGAAYARAYAKENGLLMECVIEPSKIPKKLSVAGDLPSGIVIIDDLAGTGQSIADAVEEFFTPLLDLLSSTQIPVFIVVLYATEEAEKTIGIRAGNFGSINIKLHICETLTDNNRAFRPEEIGFWKSADERDKAKVFRLSRKWTFRPLELRVNRLPLGR